MRRSLLVYCLAFTFACLSHGTHGSAEGAAKEESLRRVLCADALDWEGLLPPLTALEPLILNYARTKLAGLRMGTLGSKESELSQLGKGSIHWMVAAKILAKQGRGAHSIVWLTDFGWEILQAWQRSKLPQVLPVIPDVPRWDGDVRTLWYGDTAIKRFMLPAENQIAVLEEFQKEGWPVRIDFPWALLRRKPVAVAKRLQNETVRNLNRAQRSDRIHLRFGGDGTGNGVIWKAEFLGE